MRYRQHWCSLDVLNAEHKLRVWVTILVLLVIFLSWFRQNNFSHDMVWWKTWWICFLQSLRCFTSQEVNWWTRVMWIACGLLWCFYQLFGLSFWWHPFTAEDPLVSKWCNCYKKTHLILYNLRMRKFQFLGEQLIKLIIISYKLHCEPKSYWFYLLNKFLDFFGLFLITLLCPHRWVHCDDGPLPPEEEDRLFCDSDVPAVHHDRHPVPGVLLAQPRICSSPDCFWWV